MDRADGTTFANAPENLAKKFQFSAVAIVSGLGPWIVRVACFAAPESSSDGRRRRESERVGAEHGLFKVVFSC